jgi:hypothetical protein
MTNLLITAIAKYFYLDHSRSFYKINSADTFRKREQKYSIAIAMNNLLYLSHMVDLNKYLIEILL